MIEHKTNRLTSHLTALEELKLVLCSPVVQYFFSVLPSQHNWVIHTQKLTLKLSNSHVAGKTSWPRITPVLLNRSSGGPSAAARRPRLSRTSLRWNTFTMTHFANWSFVKGELSSPVWEGYRMKNQPQHFPQSISLVMLSIGDSSTYQLVRSVSQVGSVSFP